MTTSGFPFRKVLTLAALLASSDAYASRYVFCEIEGEIVSSSRDRSSGVGVYAMAVKTKTSKKSEFPAESQDDCSVFLDQTLDIVLVVPRGRVPGPGDIVSFQQSEIDGFDMNGHFAGTTVRSRFRALTRAKP